MRALVLADIHSNLVSLETIIADTTARGGFDEIWVLGDLVGYGPKPNECIEMLKAFPHVAVAGNHDRAAVGSITTGDFNPHAAQAARWTAEALSEDSKSYLAGLDEVVSKDNFTLAHGTLRDPIWEYLYTVDAAEAHLALQETRYSFVGHTHVPMLVEETAKGDPLMRRLSHEDSVELAEERLIMNPGSAGQPRDGDPRVCYALLDSGAATVSYFRLDYDIRETQRQMRAAGLPPYLIERLAKGR
ncbi:MAG: metallophosphoesterase family protein [Dehalococcoidia bacterium]